MTSVVIDDDDDDDDDDVLDSKHWLRCNSFSKMESEEMEREQMMQYS